MWAHMHIHACTHPHVYIQTHIYVYSSHIPISAFSGYYMFHINATLPFLKCIKLTSKVPVSAACGESGIWYWPYIYKLGNMVYVTPVPFTLMNICWYFRLV